MDRATRPSSPFMACFARPQEWPGKSLTLPRDRPPEPSTSARDHPRTRQDRRGIRRRNRAIDAANALIDFGTPGFDALINLMLEPEAHRLSASLCARGGGGRSGSRSRREDQESRKPPGPCSIKRSPRPEKNSRPKGFLEKVPPSGRLRTTTTIDDDSTRSTTTITEGMLGDLRKTIPHSRTKRIVLDNEADSDRR